MFGAQARIAARRAAIARPAAVQAASVPPNDGSALTGSPVAGAQPQVAAQPPARGNFLERVRGRFGKQAQAQTPSGVPGFMGRLRGANRAQMAQSPGTAMGGAQRMQGAIDPQLAANVERMRATTPVTTADPAQRQAMLATPSATQQQALMAQMTAAHPADPRPAEQAAYETSWANQP